MTHKLLDFVVFAALSGLAAEVSAAPPAAHPKPLPRWRKPADPEPLLTAEYLEVSVARERGVLKVLGIEKHTFGKPQVLLPRFRGRFELRLFSGGGQLRDVIRFDLPLTAGAVGAKGPEDSDTLSRKLSLGVSARTRVRVPFDASITAAVIYDTLANTNAPVDISQYRARAAPPPLKLVPPVIGKKTGTRKK